MKKMIIMALLTFALMPQAAFAEKTPVRIAPAQIISTHHDEVEVGDWIKFSTVNDVYVNEKLYIKKDTPILGAVDFFQPNGWAGDNAEIKFKKFVTTDVSGKKVNIVSPVEIKGNAKANDIKQYVAWVLSTIIRGSEIYIEPDTKSFNIFITQ